MSPVTIEVSPLSQPRAAVTLGDDLGLTCACEEQPWCIHRGYFIQRNLDVEFLHEIVPLEPRIFSVPIFPTEEVYMRVVMRRTLYDIHSSPIIVKNGEIDADQLLCVLAPGEGLGTLRRVIVDLFQQRPEQTDLECSSGGHRYSSQRAMQNMESTSEGKMKNQLSIWATGMCIHCLKNSTHWDDDSSYASTTIDTF